MTRKALLALISVLCLSIGVAAQSGSQHTDTPQKGEGMGAFLLRNGYNIQRYEKEFINLNKSRLGKNNTLLLGVKYVFPNKDTIEEPLFGEANKTVKIKNRKLAGATYYLVSGHGGPDPGAIGKYGKDELHEDEYAYDIMLRLARQLLSMGANVHIIIQDPDDGIRDESILKYDDHETCNGKPLPLDQIERLKQRCVAINEFYKEERDGYCRSVFLHLDSRSHKKQIDIFFYHYTKSIKGQRLAETLRKKLEEKYKKHQPKRGFTGTVSERQLYVLRESNPPAVFLELGNIQNWQDQQRFIKSSNREAVARWIAEGLVEDYQKEK